MKKCSRCGEEKELSGFGVDRQKSDGVMSYCKSCKKIESVRYREANIEVISLKAKLRRESNGELIREQSRRSYAKHSVDIQERRKVYNNEHKHESSEYNKRHAMSDATFKRFGNKLTIDESPKIASDMCSLEVRCKYCNRYFIPTISAVKRRIASLIGNQGGSQYLYCSSNCQNSCSLYNQKMFPKGFIGLHQPSREVQAELRQMVFEIDGWECQRCGVTTQEAELHCHHLTGVELNPIESADVDNCITLCKLHHNELHSRKGCTYADFKRKACKAKEE